MPKTIEEGCRLAWDLEREEIVQSNGQFTDSCEAEGRMANDQAEIFRLFKVNTYMIASLGGGDVYVPPAHV